MKLLFVCNQNQHRSKTAEELFKDRYETKSAGLYCEKPLNEEELIWANIVFVMEDAQRSEIASRFPKLYMQKRIISLDIPDIYRYNQYELKKALEKKLNSTIREIA